MQSAPILGTFAARTLLSIFRVVLVSPIALPLLSISQAANYLQCKSLLALGGAKMAAIIKKIVKDKPTVKEQAEDIRRRFGIHNDFTPEYE
jgi:hypothetical protein